MEFKIPSTLEELKVATREPNPVNIAGYGRESTHKGYLTWILSSEWNGIATDLISILLNHLHSSYTLSESCTAKCYGEQKLGSHRVDLLVDLIEASEKTPKKLAIELKTDAGPSSETQFAGMSEYAKVHGYLGALVFGLGSCSIQDHKWYQFKRLGPKEILDLWSPCVDVASPYVHHWMDALAHEVARQRLAHQVYLQIDSKTLTGEDLNRFGYRSYKHLMYYVYALYREYLLEHEHSKTWSIYDGGFNAVMNLDECADNWCPTGMKDVRWFFEFNDDRLCLKLEQKSDESQAVIEWVSRCIGAIESSKSPKRAILKKTSKWEKGWPMIAAWKVNFRDFNETHAAMKDIFGSFGVNGILGKL